MTIKEARKVWKDAMDRPSPLELMKIRDAADLAGLHPETIRRRIKRGELRAYGRPLRVWLNDVLAPHVPEKLKEVEES